VQGAAAPETATSATSDRPLVSFRHVSKRFPGARALEDVSFDVRRGSCHALCGENGAGKSTLGKLLAGIEQPDAGEIVVDGKAVQFEDPRDALQAGIGIVHQELAFCENLSVAENLCLGDLPTRGLFVSRSAMDKRAAAMLAAIEAPIDVRRLVGELTVAEQQMVQIAAAVGSGARVIIFDEPTSSLSQHETEHFYGLLDRLRARDVTCVLVSHRMQEIFRLSDTITVLRDGRHVATKPTSEIDEAALVQLMIGRKMEEYLPVEAEVHGGGEVLRVAGLSSPRRFADIGFSIHAGEIFGIAGLVGAGRTDIAHAIFGLDKEAEGRVEVAGIPLGLRSPAEAMRAGVGFVPEDRKRHGLVLSLRALENVTLPTLRSLARAGWLRSGAERALAADAFARLRVRAPDLDAMTVSLSGGNQQKLVLAKWLAAEGTGVLLISSELPELVSLSTRILVLRDGRLVGELARAEADQETLMRMMAGLDPGGPRLRA